VRKAWAYFLDSPLGRIRCARVTPADKSTVGSDGDIHLTVHTAVINVEPRASAGGDFEPAHPRVSLDRRDISIFAMITLLWVFLVAMVAPALAVTLLTVADAFKARNGFPIQ